MTNVTKVTTGYLQVTIFWAQSNKIIFFLLTARNIVDINCWHVRDTAIWIAFTFFPVPFPVAKWTVREMKLDVHAKFQSFRASILIRPFKMDHFRLEPKRAVAICRINFKDLLKTNSFLKDLKYLNRVLICELRTELFLKDFSYWKLYK